MNILIGLLIAYAIVNSILTIMIMIRNATVDNNFKKIEENMILENEFCDSVMKKFQKLQDEIDDIK